MAISSSTSRCTSPSRFWVTVAFVYIYFAWGVTYLGIHYAVQSMPAFFMAGARFLLAGLVMFPLLRFVRPAEFHFGSLREWKDAAVVALFILVGGNGLQAWAQQIVPSGVTALLFGSMPFWMILFDWIRPHGVAPSRRTCWGLLLGFIGVVVLVNPRGLEFSSSRVFWAEMVLLLAACFFAAGGIYSRYVDSRGSPFLPMARQLIIGGATLLIISAVDGDYQSMSLARVTLSSWLGFGYLVIFGSLLGFSTYVWLLRVSTPARVATITYLNILVAVTLGWYLLHERITWNLLVGGAITVCSVVLVLKKVDRPHQILDE